jgi:hypothetical protein
VAAGGHGTLSVNPALKVWVFPRKRLRGEAMLMCLGGCSGDSVLVELERVMGGGGQPLLAAYRAPASLLEPVDTPVEFDLAEHRLDHLVALVV